MYDVKSIVKLFTDHFRKDPESNTYKLMQLFSDELELIKVTNDRILEWRDIDQAEGATLDLIGRNVIQPRYGVSDERYRIILKSKVAKNLANGTINNFIRGVAYALDIPPEEVRVVEMWAKEGYPATLALDVIPWDKIKRAGFTTQEFEELLQSLVAAGVTLDRIVRLHNTTTIHIGAASGETLEYVFKPTYITNADLVLPGSFVVGATCGELLTLYPHIASGLDLNVMQQYSTAQTTGETITTQIQ